MRNVESPQSFHREEDIAQDFELVHTKGLSSHLSEHHPAVLPKSLTRPASKQHNVLPKHNHHLHNAMKDQMITDFDRRQQKLLNIVQQTEKRKSPLAATVPRTTVQ